MSYEQPCLDESLEYFCLNQALVCDGLAHCYDNSDEADCGEDYHSSRVVDGCQNTWLSRTWLFPLTGINTCTWKWIPSVVFHTACVCVCVLQWGTWGFPCNLLTIYTLADTYTISCLYTASSWAHTLSNGRLVWLESLYSYREWYNMWITPYPQALWLWEWTVGRVQSPICWPLLRLSILA